jgi:sulfoquinovosyltransferase
MKCSSTWQAKDTVQIVTTDVVPEAPREAFSFPIYYTEGARFALYPEIILSTDMKDQMIKKVMGLFRPDLIHCVSPSFFGVMTAFVSKWLKIPLVLSYHTHLPVYAKAYFGVFGDWCGDFMAWLAWTAMRIVHNRADLTVTVSPQIKEELEAHGIRQVDVWRKGVDTETFNPRFKSSAMRAELTEGHPEDTLLLYVGRIGKEKLLG